MKKRKICRRLSRSSKHVHIQSMSLLGIFSKPRRRRQREHHQAKGLMRNAIIAMHVRFVHFFAVLYKKRQREMTKFCVFWRTRTIMANFLYLLLTSNAVGACLA